MASHERGTPDELQLLISRLTEDQLTAFPDDLRVAIAMEDETMQRIFEKKEFPQALSEKTGLLDNIVRKSLISLRENKDADLRYIPEESRMVLGPEGHDWLTGEVAKEIEGLE
jgi:hypothetical protein